MDDGKCDSFAKLTDGQLQHLPTPSANHDHMLLIFSSHSVLMNLKDFHLEILQGKRPFNPLPFQVTRAFLLSVEGF